MSFSSAINLTLEEQEELEAISRRRTASHQLVQRARMILRLREGQAIKATAQQLGVGQNAVSYWRRRWIETGPGMSAEERLKDKERCGAPAKFTPKQITAIWAVALEKPADCGRPIAFWSLGELRNEVIKRGIVEEISKKSISRFLKGGRPAPGQGPVLDQHASGRGFRSKAGSNMRDLREGTGKGAGRGENAEP